MAGMRVVCSHKEQAAMAGERELEFPMLCFRLLQPGAGTVLTLTSYWPEMIPWPRENGHWQGAEMFGGANG